MLVQGDKSAYSRADENGELQRTNVLVKCAPIAADWQCERFGKGMMWQREQLFRRDIGVFSALLHLNGVSGIPCNSSIFLTFTQLRRFL